ncbi:CoA transferase [Streptomyces laurentii]|uniref:CoA transferase n=1 Tax=Streptomyces laurentii TaxID=39478 RepID=UPI0036AE0669
MTVETPGRARYDARESTRTAVSVAEELLHRTVGALPAPPAPSPRETAAWSVDGTGPVAIDAGDEYAVQAACGVMHVHGRAVGFPQPLTAGYVSSVTGVLAAAGSTATLFARRRGHDPLRVRTSLAQGALLALTQYLAADTAGDGEGLCHADGATCPERAAERATGQATLVTSDGARVEIETLDPTAWAGFWRRLGVPGRVAGQGWAPFQQRFGTATCALPEALLDAMARTPLSAVRAAAEASGVSVADVYAWAIAAPPGLLPWSMTPPPPALAQARQARQARPARTRPPHTRLHAHEPALPLAGVRVVESARRVQGPMAGHVLRLLGADVVRVEPPGGDPMRGLPPMAGDCSARFSALNAGKTVVEADITTPGGRDTVCALVADADVFLHNWAPGKARALGLDADVLHRVRPGLVYAAASGFGTALGPVPPIGTDYLAQVYGGLAAALRPAGEPAAPSLMTLTDVLGGLLLAQAVLAGLVARETTRLGCLVESSLLSAAALVPRAGHRVRMGVLDRPLPTADGLLYAGAAARERPEEVARAAGVTGIAALGRRLRERGTREWLELLRDADLPAVAVCTGLDGLAADPAFVRAVRAPDARVPHARPARPWDFDGEW